MSSREADFLSQVYAAPHDDAPRLVYADWLLQRGDPRGELISLQLDRWRRGDDWPSARESELLAAHEEAWLGPLWEVLVPGTVVFQRGFLAECAVRFESPAQKHRLLQDRRWGTVEKLAAEPDVVTHPIMRGVWSLGPIEPAMLGELRGWDRLMRISEIRFDADAVGYNFFSRRFGDIEREWPRFPNLHDVAILYRDYHPEWSTHFPLHGYRGLYGGRFGSRGPSLRIRSRLMRPVAEYERDSRPRPDLAAWAEALGWSTPPRLITLEPCHGWTFAIWREQEDRVLRIDWRPARATGDLAGLQRAMITVVKETFSRVHVHIDGVQRRHYQRMLAWGLRGIERFSFSARQPLGQAR